VVERILGKAEVVSSILTGSTIFSLNHDRLGRLISLLLLTVSFAGHLSAASFRAFNRDIWWIGLTMDRERDRARRQPCLRRDAMASPRE